MSEALKMHSIAAGPDFQAQPGDVVFVDDKKLAAALKAGTYAEPAGSSRASRAETSPPPADPPAATLTADAIAKLKSKANVSAALAGLDPTNDEHWTAAGLPAMGEIEARIGTKEITRAEVSEMFPDFKRPPAPGGTGGNGDELKQDGPTVAEYVERGYLAKNYPPSGYASKSTAEEIAAAVKAQEEAEAAKVAEAAKSQKGAARSNI